MKKRKLLYFLCCLSAESVAADPVYLDYAAAEGVSQEALNEFNRVVKMQGNSSGFNANAKILKKIEKDSATIIANKLKCQSQNILFTCSATIANNIAILGVAYKYSPSECHLITSKIEHKSVLNVFKHLEEMGYSVTYLDVDRYGRVNLAQLSKSLRKETRLVSIQAFNSEIGIMQDMKKISAVVHRHSNALLHSDISQLFCKYPVDVSFLDMATFSGYKIGSPKGIAALYVKDFQKLTPIVFGSGNSLWPGTVPTELVSSFASAVKVYKMDLQKVTSLFEILRKEIMKIEDVFINSINPTHVFSVSIKGVLLKDVIQEMKDFSFSSGCSCLGQGESNVKEAIDPEGKLPSCTLRLSFSDSVSPAMIIKFAARLHFVVDTLRKRKKVTEGCENDNSKLVDILSDIKL